MNNKTFLENYRANAPLGGTLTTPSIKEPGYVDSFVGSRGKMPDDYGRQQNTIGMTALSILLSAMGLTPEAIAATAFVNRKEGQENPPSIKGVPVESGLNDMPIDKTPGLSNLFKGLVPISPDSSREELMKGLRENSKIIEQNRDLLKMLKRIGR